MKPETAFFNDLRKICIYRLLEILRLLNKLIHYFIMKLIVLVNS